MLENQMLLYKGIVLYEIVFRNWIPRACSSVYEKGTQYPNWLIASIIIHQIELGTPIKTGKHHSVSSLPSPSLKWKHCDFNKRELE